MNGYRDRRGMTLIELIFVVVLGAIVLGAMYQVLVTNQRTYAAQNSHVRGQQTLRGGLEVLTSELREISPRDGDLLQMQPTALTIRASRGLGLVCQVLSSGMHPTVQAKRIGNYLQDDSARVFYENHPSREADDDWRTAQVVPLDSTGILTCPGGGVAQEVRLRGIRWGSRPDSFTRGAPIRAFVHYQYLMGARGGETYLMRVDPDGTETPVVGPLDPSNGVEFQYLDSVGDPATTAPDVRQVEVKLRTAPARRGNQGDLRQDSLSTLVYTRNTN